GGGNAPSPSTSCRPRPCEPKSGFSTSGRPGLASRRTRAAASAGFSIAQVGGVGRPARCSRKLVIDLSTQRSMARASLTTGTPSAGRACSTPSGLVTCSKLPAAIVLTMAAAGRPAAKPGSDRPPSTSEKPQSCSDNRTGSAPRRSKAAPSWWACQSGRSMKMAILGRVGMAEGPVDERLVERAGMEAVAAVERRHGGAGRVKERGADVEEAALVGREDLGEGPAIVARAAARQRLRQAARRLIRAGNEELHRTAIDDGVVGAAHGGD